MLWINLIMDTFAAMALASLPPSPKVMQDKPRDRKAFILNKSMYANILGVGTAFFLMLLVLTLIFQHADINSVFDLFKLQLGEANPITPYEQTLLFSIFVWTHFWYMFNSRTYGTDKSMFDVPYGTSFWIIIGVILLGQILIVEVGYNFFNVEPMFHNATHPNAWLDWVLIVALSSVVLWIREIWNIICNLFKK
jgi:Ca2+-transporting ATPase